MGDNLANRWGCDLCMLPANQRRNKEGDALGDGGMSILKDIVKGTLNQQFELTKVATCGDLPLLTQLKETLDPA